MWCVANSLLQPTSPISTVSGWLLQKCACPIFPWPSTRARRARLTRSPSGSTPSASSLRTRATSPASAATARSWLVGFARRSCCTLSGNGSFRPSCRETLAISLPPPPATCGCVVIMVRGSRSRRQAPSCWWSRYPAIHAPNSPTNDCMCFSGFHGASVHLFSHLLASHQPFLHPQDPLAPGRSPPAAVRPHPPGSESSTTRKASGYNIMISKAGFVGLQGWEVEVVKRPFCPLASRTYAKVGVHRPHAVCVAPGLRVTTWIDTLKESPAYRTYLKGHKCPRC